MSSWQRDAGCRDTDPELFFPAGRDDSHLVAAHLRAVRPICGACPVAVDCWRWALDTGQEHGLWAASTPTQRRRERRRERDRRRYATTSYVLPADLSVDGLDDEPATPQPAMTGGR